MTRRPIARAAALLGSAALLLTAPAVRAQTFDFETAAGATPFPLTSGGVTATFGNPGQPFYEILDYGAGVFAGLAGNVLGDATADLVVSPLGIDFDVPIVGISLRYALTSTPPGFPGTQLTLDAFLGATPVGSATFTPVAGPSFPEGVVTFAGAAFDRVVLASDAADFAIDDVAVSPAVVPEPATLGLAGLGLAGLGLAALAAAARARRLTTPSARGAR